MNYDGILERLWTDYSELNPSVHKIHSLLSKRGEAILNDHIALRTFNLDNMNIEVLSEIFKDSGYIEKGTYTFEEKHLKAKHYEHKVHKLAPKVFISELVIQEFSAGLQDVAKSIAGQIKKNGITNKKVIFSKTSWEPLKYGVYEMLRQESEYAAWFYVFGFRANHFTVYVNHLKSVKNLEGMNIYLKENGFRLNTSGGEIKGSEKSLLRQSSTLADRISVNFEEGAKEIPCCYYEFAERFSDEKGEIFNGFIADSADKIFESTDNK